MKADTKLSIADEIMPLEALLYFIQSTSAITSAYVYQPSKSPEVFMAVPRIKSHPY